MEIIENSVVANRKRRLRDIGKQEHIKLRKFTPFNSDINSVPVVSAGHQETFGNHSTDECEAMEYRTKQHPAMSFRHNEYICEGSNKGIKKISTDLSWKGCLGKTMQSEDKTIVKQKKVSDKVSLSKNPQVRKSDTCVQVTKPEKLQRNDSGYSSDELSTLDEDDIFQAVDINVKAQSTPPDSVDGSCAWSRFSESSPVENELFQFGQPYLRTNHCLLAKMMHPFANARPEQVTEIFIKHEYATDSEMGDKFGAKLETYGTSSYKQHFFYDVTPRGPADQMKIRNYDELVLINDVFVPNLTHTDVLNLIHNVKVDGKTRFVLIIRRVEEKTRSKKQPYQWFETKSILVPDIRTLLSPPIIKDLHYQPLENNRYEHKTWCRLRVKGTQLYLNIETTGINATVLHDDKRDETKNIMQWAVYRDNPSTNKPEFVAALRGHDNMSYVAVDANAVVVSRNPEWFVYGLIGTEVCFKAEDTCKYIACDRMSGHLAAQSEQFFFQRYPLPHDQDYPDAHASSQSSMSSQSSQSSSSSQSNILSSSGYISLNDSDVEMDTSDCVSSPQPTANTFVGEDVLDGRINPAFDGGVLKNTRITRSMSRQTSLARNGLDMMTI